MNPREFREVASTLMKELRQKVILFGDEEAIYLLCNKAVEGDCRDKKVGKRDYFDVGKLEETLSAVNGQSFILESIFLPSPKSWATAVGLWHGWGIAYGVV